MAKKGPPQSDRWQPSLFDTRATSRPPAVEETRVEYDQSALFPRTREPVFTRGGDSDSPWWDRVRALEESGARPDASVAWGAQWLRVLRGEGWTVDLPERRRTPLEESVRGLELRAGVVEASSAGERGRPHRVQLRVATLSASEWARLARQIADEGEADGVRQALGEGLLPLALVDAADRHRLALVPRRLNTAVQAACTCGGARLPCEHVLAVHFVLARRLDKEPLRLLELRGGRVDELVELLERAAPASGPQTTQVIGAVDPFATPRVDDAPDWSLVEGQAPARAPLPSPEGWRARETFDALVRRLWRTAVRAEEMG